MSPGAGRQQLLESVSEQQFRAQVQAWAERRGWMVYFTWNSRHSPAGFPDLVLCRPPRLIVVELKAMRGKLEARQREWHSALRAVAFVEVYIWRPTDEEAIEDILR